MESVPILCHLICMHEKTLAITCLHSLTGSPSSCVGQTEHCHVKERVIAWRYVHNAEVKCVNVMMAITGGSSSLEAESVHWKQVRQPKPGYTIGGLYMAVPTKPLAYLATGIDAACRHM